MTRKQKYQFVTDYFLSHAPDAETELFYDNPYQLLVAVILSAQCTDKRVNQTTPAIFKRFPTPAKLAKAAFEEVFTKQQVSGIQSLPMKAWGYQVFVKKN